MAGLIDAGWEEYRGWARRARGLQRWLGRWTIASLVCAIGSALLLALAVEIEGHPWARGIALAGAVAAALAPVIGRELRSASMERKWLRARAVAEAIKSECFRVAGGLAPYDCADPAERVGRFVDWRTTTTAAAAEAGLTILMDPLPAGDGDDARPHSGMDADWYLEHRVCEQKRYFIHRQAGNERAARWLRGLNAGAAGLAAGLAAIGAAGNVVTAWPGVFITAATAIMAVSLLERRQSLATQYGAMALALARIEEWYGSGHHDLGALVDRTETLLGSEHEAWIQSMQKTPAARSSVGPAED